MSRKILPSVYLLFLTPGRKTGINNMRRKGLFATSSWNTWKVVSSMIFGQTWVKTHVATYIDNCTALYTNYSNLRSIYQALLVGGSLMVPFSRTTGLDHLRLGRIWK